MPTDAPAWNEKTGRIRESAIRLLRHGGGVWLVFLVLPALFVLTGLISQYYHTQLQHRADAYFKQGQGLAKKGLIADAVEQYRSALSCSPRNDQYQVALASALFDLGHLDEARAHLGEVGEDQPNNSVANEMLARIAARQGQADEAVTYYHRAIYGLWPADPGKNRIEARFELVNLLIHSGQNRAASAELLQLANEAPGNVAVKIRVGTLLLTLGYPSNARDEFEEALSVEPRNPEAASGAGQADFALRNYKAAARHFRRAVRLRPSDTAARQSLQETEQILDADPTPPTLSAAQRYQRSKDLLAATLASLDRCAPPDSPEKATLDQQAAAMLNSKKRRRPGADASQAALLLAQQVWDARAKVCGTAPPDERWLSLVMREVGR